MGGQGVVVRRRFLLVFFLGEKLRAIRNTEAIRFSKDFSYGESGFLVVS